MAFQVKFKGFVHDIREGKFGIEVVVKHATRKPDGKGGWELVRTDYVTCTAPTHEVSVGDFVEVTGTISQTVYTAKTGEAKLSLRVRTETMSHMPVRSVETRPAAPVSIPEAVADDFELPF